MRDGTMQSAILRGSRLELVQLPIPVPRGGDLLIAVQASGLCGSDVRLAQESQESAQLLRLGHEVVGTVVKAGPMADPSLTVGTRVVALPCLRRDGRLEWFGESPDTPGAFAEYSLVDSTMALAIPSELGSIEATFVEPLAVAMHAVARAGLRPQDRTVVVGAGPLGLATLLALQASGVKDVHVVERRESRRSLAFLAGAASAHQSPSLEALSQPASLSLYSRNGLLTLPDVSNDPRTIVFETAGTPGILADICRSVGNGARIVALGLHGGVDSLPIRECLTKQIELRFCIVYNMVHFASALNVAVVHRNLLSSLVHPVHGFTAFSDAWSALIDGSAQNAKKTVLCLEHPRGH